MAMCPLMSMVATLVFKQPAPVNLIVTWMQTVAANFPMALLWQIFIAGPVVRFLVGLIPERVLERGKAGVSQQAS